MKIHRRKIEGSALHIEFWYDRSARSWFSGLYDDAGYSIGDSMNDGSRAGVEVSIRILSAGARKDHPSN